MKKFFSTRTIIAICVVCSLAVISVLLIGCDTNQGPTNEVNGIISAEINENGELIISYSDGTEQNLGVVVGKDGINGVDGKDGIDGVDGVDGKDGIDGADGLNGVDGKDGVDGVDGKDGVDGVDGKDGINGKDGVNGKDGSLIISGEGSSISTATARGLLSSVSILCSFPIESESSDEEADTLAAGSGVIYKLDSVSGSAFIITNYHVVYSAKSTTENGISDNISVYLYGSEINTLAIPATYIGGSMNYDIAVLYIENSDILKASCAKEITVSNSDEVILGETAIAIGNPQGAGISATYGVVSVDSEHITMIGADEKTDVTYRVMRIDTAVNSGNSGGGLFNKNGELIGIVNAKSVQEHVDNIGYAIPSNLAIAVADNIIDHCFGNDTCESVRRALLGISIITSDSRSVYDIETGNVRVEETVIVHQVNEGIANGYLKEGDILLSISMGDRIYNISRQHHPIDFLLTAREGDTVVITVLRDGETISYPFLITSECMALS